MDYDWASPANPSGQPPRFWRDGQLSFIMNGPAPPSEGYDAAKWVDDPEEWVKVNAAYKISGKVIRPLVIKDEKRDSADYRTWRVTPELVGGRPAAMLFALTASEDGFGGVKSFRGQEAWVAEPLIMTRSMRHIVDYIGLNADFTSVDVAASYRGAWGTSSKTIALMNGSGIVAASKAGSRLYPPGCDEILQLKTDRDAVNAPGNRRVYEKSLWWDEFIRQWNLFLQSADKTRPYVPP